MPVTTRAPGVSIVMPAYRAEASIARAATSVLAQTHADWELLIVADDGADYASVLGQAGIADPRIRYFSTGAVGSGSPPARNIGLDHARFEVSAILDADDAMMPDKLTRALTHLQAHGVVSCAIEVQNADGRKLRTVGEGPDRVLRPGAYKFVNLSMDSMLVYDRLKADPRFNPDFPCLTDIEFLLRLWETNETVFHLGTPLHAYVKHPTSISNRPGAGAAMIATKVRILDLLSTGAYPLAAEDGRLGLMRFYSISLAAEELYGARLSAQPGLLFEDHLEPMLATGSA